ncbi:MAG: SDR family NAD(P)-dependent oxidoreductase [Pseudomonadota bacterium]
MFARNAVVTGSASGVGEALCARLALAGSVIMALDKSDHGAAAAATGGRFWRCDVTSRNDWQSAATAITGAPTFVALNAGIMTRPPEAALTDDIFGWIATGGYDRVMRVNVDGVVFGLEALLPLMSDGGAIVVTCSMAGLSPLPFDPFYAASKHAVVGLVRSLAPVLKARGIKINAFCPGGIATKLVPMQLAAASPLLMSVEEAADTILDIAAGTSSGETWIKSGPGEPLTIVAAPNLMNTREKT